MYSVNLVMGTSHATEVKSLSLDLYLSLLWSDETKNPIELLLR